MFFTAFESPRMSPEFIFTVEYHIAQILAGCDRTYLASACETDTLATSLANELDFFGFYHKSQVGESVKNYLIAHNQELLAFARKILADPDNNHLLDESLLPHRIPTSFPRQT